VTTQPSSLPSMSTAQSTAEPLGSVSVTETPSAEAPPVLTSETVNPIGDPESTTAASEVCVMPT
jgi:hypothetical protein